MGWKCVYDYGSLDEGQSKCRVLFIVPKNFVESQAFQEVIMSPPQPIIQTCLDSRWVGNNPPQNKQFLQLPRLSRPDPSCAVCKRAKSRSLRAISMTTTAGLSTGLNSSWLMAEFTTNAFLARPCVKCKCMNTYIYIYKSALKEQDQKKQYVGVGGLFENSYVSTYSNCIGNCRRCVYIYIYMYYIHV